MSELTRLTGVGPKRLKALESSGIRTLRDLVYYLPRRYVDRTRITPISSLREGMDAFLPVNIDFANAVGTPGVVLLGSFKNFATYNPFSGGYAGTGATNRND